MNAKRRCATKHQSGHAHENTSATKEREIHLSSKIRGKHCSGTNEEVVTQPKEEASECGVKRRVAERR